MFKENLPKRGPLFREFWIQKPTHMGGTYPQPQYVMLPSPLPPGSVVISFNRRKCFSSSRRTSESLERIPLTNTGFWHGISACVVESIASLRSSLSLFSDGLAESFTAIFIFIGFETIIQLKQVPCKGKRHFKAWEFQHFSGGCQESTHLLLYMQWNRR